MSWLLRAPHHRRRTFFGEFTAQLHDILPIHNVTIKRTFTFRVGKSSDGKHPAFGGTLDRRCHSKHVSFKQSRFYHCQTSTVHRYRIKIDGSVATISIKNSLSDYTWCIFTFRTRRVHIYIYIYIHIYWMSQEECAILRESVPYVKMYRYNPKHLCPNLNGYGDNGQRSLKFWQLLRTYWLPNTY